MVTPVLDKEARDAQFLRGVIALYHRAGSLEETAHLMQISRATLNRRMRAHRATLSAVKDGVLTYRAELAQQD